MEALLLCPCCRYQEQGKLTFNLKPFALNSVLPEGRGGYSNARVVATTLNTFMASVDETISLKHVPAHRTNKAGVRKPVKETKKPVPPPGSFVSATGGVAAVGELQSNLLLL